MIKSFTIGICRPSWTKFSLILQNRYMHYFRKLFAALLIHNITTEVGYVITEDHYFNNQDKILEDQFYDTCEQEEESNNQNNMLVRPRLFPQSAPKRQITSLDNNKPYPDKKACLKSSSGTSSSKSIPPGDDSIGLTLRVVPYNPVSSTSDTPSSFAISALPSLTKPLLRVSASSVSLDKIQRFIHKRMGAPSTFAPDDIEILRDGVIQLASSSISHYPILDSTILSGLDASVKPPLLPEKVIILTYRQSVKLEKGSISDTVSSSSISKHV